MKNVPGLEPLEGPGGPARPAIEQCAADGKRFVFQCAWRPEDLRLPVFLFSCDNDEISGCCPVITFADDRIDFAGNCRQIIGKVFDDLPLSAVHEVVLFLDHFGDLFVTDGLT